MTSETLIKMSSEDKHGVKTSAGGRATGDLWDRKDLVPLGGRKARAWNTQRGRGQLMHSLVNCVIFPCRKFYCPASCSLESQSERNKSRL